ncbi:MAG: hypothetical protein KIT09_19400 [Bryobacteraceae bacterium]|nr:hypothetical protein [Bryobacteraceae bacterium]
MFGVAWSDPQNFWINVTNLAMGIFVLLAVVGVAWAFIGDMRDRAKARASQRAMASAGGHAFFETELGLTMADGGEPESPKDPKPESR